MPPYFSILLLQDSATDGWLLSSSYVMAMPPPAGSPVLHLMCFSFLVGSGDPF